MMRFNDDEPIVLPPGTTRPTVAGRVQLAIRNNDKAPLKENIQKVMLELTGEENSRSGLDLVVVLDLSRSMDEENKLEELKTAMLFVMKKLTTVDRLSIVKYSTEAKRLCPLRQMTESTQTELENLINDLEADGSTNIKDGLETALNILKNRSVSSGRVGAVMLMSDGKQNQGSDAADVQVGNVPVHTFGFGESQDPKVFRAIANNSRLGGTYSDVGINNLNLAFSQCLGGLLSVVAQNLTLTLTQIDDQSTIKHVSAGNYPQDKNNAAGSVTITFGDIYIQEIRKVLIDLHLPSTRMKKDVDVLEVSYTYKFVGELIEASPVTVTVCRMSGLTAGEQQALPDVRAEEVRLHITEAIKQASTDADKEDLKSAQDKLVIGLLNLEDTDLEKLKAEIRPELEELLKLMQTQAIYENQGRSFAYSLLISLTTQRQMARGNNISKFQLFATPAMKKLFREAKNFQDPFTISIYDYGKIFVSDSPEPKTIVSGKVQLEIRNNNTAPLEKNIQKVLLKLSGEENSLSGLDVVAVLDVSSSMEGDKFAKMKIAMLLLIESLSINHRLSIIQYSRKAKRLCPLVRMTESSQTKLKNMIDNLKAQPGTNITDGLKTALNVLKGRSDCSGRVGVIMLMSDGEQNQGSDAADIQVGSIPVLTFGFGEDHNPEVLIAIANNSLLGGTYVEVCMDDLNLTFPHCLAELQSVVVWDLTVTVTQIKNKSTVKWASAGRYLQSIDNAAGSITITFGTLYIKQVYKVLVDIVLPVTKREDVVDILKVSYTYRNSFDGELCEANSATVTVRRMSKLTAEEQQPPLEVTNVEARILIAEMIKQATGFTNKEDLRSVRDKLVHSLKTLDLSYIRDLSKELIQLGAELIKLSELMQSQAINEKQGHSFAYSLLISNFTQRGWTKGIDEFKLFATPAMQEFLEEAKVYDEIDYLHVYIDRFIGAIESILTIIRKVECEHLVANL